jgi:adenosylcobinamide kinase/adenosylcobinamide-phosphate guanylyltransferase
MKTLILGGARSGKSRLAESIAASSCADVAYVATALADDAEMQARIDAHRVRRPPAWTVVEEPLALARALRALATSRRCIVVDCLTLWLSNALLHANEQCWPRERAELLTTLRDLPGEVVLVGNETGMGIVPMGELTRRFRDESGWLHQELAALCDRVLLSVAGLPLTLKGEPWSPIS